MERLATSRPWGRTPGEWLRRSLLLAWLGALTAGLVACGFALRQAGDFAFRTLYPNFPAQSAMGVELRRNLVGTGRITLIEDPRRMLEADVILDLSQETRRQVVVGMNASGQVREMQLRLSVVLRLRTPQGQDLIEPVTLEQQRDLNFSETAALSKDIEQAMIYRDMQSEIVHQIMRRIATVRMPGPRS